MRDKGASTFTAILPAAGAGILFIVFWLFLGVPLVFSAGASLAGYIALWTMRKGLLKPPRESAVPGNFVDLELARKTSAQGRELAKTIGEQLSGFDARDPLAAKFRRLTDLQTAIAADVEADPKDAMAAATFLGFQGEAVPRLARLTLELQGRGASPSQLLEARKKIGLALDRLIKTHEQHLARLQEDNLAELQVELDVLEESLGLDEEIEESLGSQGRMPDEAKNPSRPATG